MHILSIDPGMTGAVAILPGSFPVLVFDMPVVAGRIDAGSVHHLLCEHSMPDAHCFIERAQAMPGQGVTGMFNYGMSYGVLLGILVALRISYTEVSASQWKRALKLGKDKEVSRLRAMQLFPQCDLHLKKHHGRAEALLLGWWGQRQHASAS